MTQKNQLPVRNPIVGASAFGLGGAISVALAPAAWFHKENLKANSLTMLAGGAVTGAIAGSVGCFIPEAPEGLPLTMHLILGFLDASLSLTAYFTAPLMGEAILNDGTQWSEIIVMDLAGKATIAAGACGLAAVAVGVSVLGRCCSTLFSGHSDSALTRVLNPPVMNNV